MMQLTQMSVLVVEDMEAIRKIMVEQLRQLGFGQVLQAENSRRGIELLDEAMIDILILDWSMPGGNGLDLLKAMRAQPKWQSIPVILVTANTHRGMVLEAIKYNVADIVAKPFTSKTLQNRVWQALKAERKTFFEELAIDDAPTQVESEHNPEKNTVLVVDDMPDNLVYLVGLLKDDYKVCFAKDGVTALKICQSSTPPDLVLLDVMMPEMDGYQVLQAMREHPQTDHIPVVFVTALSEEMHHIQGLAGGAVDYITKPVQPEILKLRVKNLIATVNLQRDLQANYDNVLKMARLKASVEDIVHHDIKGPMAAISALAQRLVQDKSCPRELASKISLIEEMANQSIATVTLFSVLYRIETGRFTLQPVQFSLHQMIRRILNSMHVSFHYKQLVAFQVPDEDPNNEFDAFGDPTLSYSMLLNLIKNAFEAAKLRTKVAIHLERHPMMIHVTIENSGVVPDEIRSGFWDKYVTQGKSEGTGLGTYSARLLAQAQGGGTDLKVDDLNDITQVTVSIPAPARTSE